jgi:predicted nucleotidyltransferase component of viral defense system
MSSTDWLQKVKRHTIAALVSDDLLVGILVLKGGNALDLAYEISNRGSIDIDFSIERDFTNEEKGRLLSQISHLLNTEFAKIKLVAFDIKFSERPQKINDAVAYFWGGYLLEFKVIEEEKFKVHGNDEEVLRRNAIPLHQDKSTKFTVDISKYEYIGSKRPKDIEGAVVYVYSPEMLAIEKLRALCQQVSDYRSIVHSFTPKPRARDFYDIYNLISTFNIDLSHSENIELIKNIFSAKRVPLEYLSLLSDYKEFHRQNWESVLITVMEREGLKEYDYYFDFVLSLVPKNI